MKSAYRILLMIAFLLGLLIGVAILEDVQLSVDFPFAKVFLIIAGIYLLFCITYINIYHNRKGLKAYLFPLLLVVLYLPMNILAGLYVHSGSIRYFSSFPRFGIIVYVILALSFVYILARAIDNILKYKYSKVIFVLTDVISLAIIPIIFIVTYFVSPH